jgi:hypothetical protein
MYWFTLRKTSSIIHVAYDHTNATLFAESVRVRADDPFDVSIDLNKNLRTHIATASRPTSMLATLPRALWRHFKPFNSTTIKCSTDRTTSRAPWCTAQGVAAARCARREVALVRGSAGVAQTEQLHLALASGCLAA